jgi:Nickel responsive protein SCO4226-like
MRLPGARDRFLTGRSLETGEEQSMPKFVIERELPGAGQLTSQQLQAISQRSCGVLHGMGTQIQWVQSYVTDDKIYCIYIAPNEQAVLEHARQGEFPANRVSRIRAVIDPTTAD